MSGRINPREYDLGELRDAVRETTPGCEPPWSGEGSGESDDRTGVAVEFRDGGRKARSPIDDPSKRRTQRNHSVLEDPEAYIRSRHRRGGWAVEAPGRAHPRDEREGSVRTRERREPARSTANRRSEHEAALELLASSSGTSVSRPYLAELPGTYGAQLAVFEWLERLVSKAGRGETVSALEYYESIEWLSPESRAKLETFVDGIGTTRAAAEPLDVTDHRESLAYIARLAERSRSNR